MDIAISAHVLVIMMSYRVVNLLGQAPSACPEMTQDAFTDAADAQKEAWLASDKKTQAGICGVVNGRVMQECRFPDGYASTQNVALSDTAPPSCDALWAQRQQQPSMGRRLGQAQAPVSVKELGDAAFGEVLAAPKAVALFHSLGCPYSRAFMPIYQGIAAQYPDVLFTAVNVDQAPQNAGTYKVRMLPTAVFFVNGKEVNRIDGVQDQGDFVGEMGRAFAGQSPGPAAPAPEATAPPRSGTLVEAVVPPPSPSPLPLILGGVATAGVLGVIGYLIFGGK